MKTNGCVGLLAAMVFCVCGSPVHAQVLTTAGPGVAGTTMERASVLSDTGRASGEAGTMSQMLVDGPVPWQLQTAKNRSRGALWGGGIGLVAGGILGGLSVESEDAGLGGDLVEASATGEAVLVGAVVGAGLGALLGATVFAPSVVVEGGYEVRLRPVATLQRVGVLFQVH